MAGAAVRALSWRPAAPMYGCCAVRVGHAQRHPDSGGPFLRNAFRPRAYLKMAGF